MNINKSYFFITWIVLSILLAGLLLASLHYHLGTSFFKILNVLNAALLIASFLFWRKIQFKMNLITAKTDSFQARNANTHITVEYRHGPFLGKLFIAVVCVAGLCALVVSVFDAKAYFELIQEDGPVEYASALFWFTAALVLFISVFRNKKQYSFLSYRILPHLLLGMFFIVCAGEEISWGQRILDLETPDFLQSVNVQKEITLHNIASISIFSNGFFLMTLVFFLLIPYIKSRNELIQKLVDYYTLPVPNFYVVIVFGISLFIWAFIGVRFGTLGFHPFSFYTENYYNQMDDEIFECLAAYSFFCYSVMHFFRRTSISQNA